MHALLAALAFLGSQAGEPIRNGTLHRKEINPRTGREEVVAIVQWDEAVPGEGETLDLRGVRARYFTEPRPGGIPSETVELQADRARYDGPAGRLDLTERVRISHQDGTVLTAPSAKVFFQKKPFCAACGTEEAKPGPCPRCGAETRPRTSTSVEGDEEFSLERPGLRLSGRELRADDRFGRLVVGREGFLEMAGRPTPPGEKPRPSSPSEEKLLTEIRCDGPLAIQELSPDRTGFSLEARQNVRLRRRDAAGTVTTVTADQVEIIAQRRRDPRTGRFTPRPVPEKVSARGRLTLEDTEGLRAGAETMDWESREVLPAPIAAGGVAGTLLEALGATRHERARLEGAPVTLAQGSNRVRARTVDIDRQAGRTVFSGDVAASFSLPERPEARPLELSCRILSATLTPGAGGLRPRFVEALGEVRLEGLMEREGAAPARAEGDRFAWTLEEQRGFLEGRPFARIRQGPSDILAPRVVLEGSTVVLKGPKRLRLVQEEEGRATAFVVSSEGDVILDPTGRVLFPGRTVVRSDDFRLAADRMELSFAAGGKGLTSLRAAGDVRVERGRDGLHLYGDRLRYAPGGRALSILGFPRAVAEAEGRTVWTREIRFHEKARTTELRGGAEGVLIVIEEAGGPGTGNGPQPGSP